MDLCVYISNQYGCHNNLTLKNTEVVKFGHFMDFEFKFDVAVTELQMQLAAQIFTSNFNITYWIQKQIFS